jgi:hypothetical protein
MGSGGFNRFRRPELLAVAFCTLSLAVTGCATTDKKSSLQLTGNLLVDGPNAIANGPPRDKVLWQYRTALAYMRQGDFGQAKVLLDDALLRIGGVFSQDKSAKQSRGYFREESRKTFLGEPYERCMAYVYRGMLYWMDGEPDNARACFRSAQLADSDTANREYGGDWVLADYLDGLASAKLGGDGSDALKRAQASSKGISLPPYNTKANVLVFIEFGPGPRKIAGGEYGEELRITTSTSPVRSAALTFDTFNIPVAPTDDVAFQATTRGGRLMDHILGNKAVFKSTTDTVGNVALIGGLGTAVVSHDRATQQVGLGIALAGLISKVVSSATTPAADVRTWDNLPQYLTFVNLELAPGKHTLTAKFLDASGNPLPNLTKQITFEVPAGKDKILFVSDQSATPLNL